ncbi:Hypothetical predicted protein [Octopus vulgaris]|uniref:Uncharacterized protein n=1 Tax=Octopus vulgaris TaxID=6645 RepID=A0AA36B253_OCTVU|nr:Hypothetical predicted protein [Octopus vulgaris]
MYVCVCVCESPSEVIFARKFHTYNHPSIHPSIQLAIHPSIHPSTHTYTYAYSHAHERTYTHIHTHTHTQASVCVCVCVCGHVLGVYSEKFRFQSKNTPKQIQNHFSALYEDYFHCQTFTIPGQNE